MRHRLAFVLRRWATLLDDRGTFDYPKDTEVAVTVHPDGVVVRMIKPGLDTVNFHRLGHEPETHTARKLSDPGDRPEA